MDDDFSVLELFVSMLWFFLFICWIYLLVMLATDIFRSRDLRGWAKALWILFLVILPVLGSLVYLIVRGEGMAERRRDDLAQQERVFRTYVQDAARESTSTADELEKLAHLRNAGTITDAEFESQKAKLLA
jgi:type VI protein secretion system component VasK